ncbi:hypothetical protein LWI29_024076 [Acer saccharum]|uniref:glucan endo-1,3-beta-D-glucosidase n=1 Tax=Acer saccharum TaxID=4024 RepID=A0AA39V977_ACESA|nr:hypothetical protein LWI29_024076 [Acer saccharum]
MIGIPNDLLAPIASSVSVASSWVEQNVSKYISTNGVDVSTKNIQAALIKAGLGRQVKATVPLNADVYESADSGRPSTGDFRGDIHDLMISIVKFLSDNGAPLTINIYPFLSLYADSNFPVDFAFFNASGAAPVVDGSITYTNVSMQTSTPSYQLLKRTVSHPSLSSSVKLAGRPTATEC